MPADRLSWGAGLAQVHLETSLLASPPEGDTQTQRGGTSQAQSQPCEAQSMLENGAARAPADAPVPVGMAQPAGGEALLPRA